MILLLLAMTVMQHDSALPTWASDLLRKSPPPVQKPAVVSAPDEATMGSRDGRVRMFPPEMSDQIARCGKMSAQIYKLIADGREDQAFKLAEQLWEENANLKEFAFDETIDASILSAHYEKARRIIESMLVHPWKEVELPLLKLSLCLAAQGTTFPGQDEYCQALQRHYWSTWGHRDALLQHPPSRRPSIVALDSALAIGLADGRGSTTYLEVAFKMEPDSIIAARELIERYDEGQRFDQERRVALSIASHLPVGDQKSHFEKVAADAARRMEKG